MTRLTIPWALGKKESGRRKNIYKKWVYNGTNGIYLDCFWAPAGSIYTSLGLSVCLSVPKNSCAQQELIARSCLLKQRSTSDCGFSKSGVLINMQFWAFNWQIFLLSKHVYITQSWAFCKLGHSEQQSKLFD